MVLIHTLNKMPPIYLEAGKDYQLKILAALFKSKRFFQIRKQIP